VIAERYIGDFDRYHDIQTLNPDFIDDPNIIQPKWWLILPADAYDRGARIHATGQLVVKTQPLPPTRPSQTRDPPNPARVAAAAQPAAPPRRPRPALW
jgi:hypothetical protein